MKFACAIIGIFAILAFVAADADYYPKSFYRLDSNGNKGRIFYFNPNHIRRVRRQIFGSSSSSSSSTSGDGGTFFHTSGTTYGNPPYGSPLSNRFGDSPVVGAHYSTSGVVTPDGNVYYQQNGYPIQG